jgi:hypothetical protein
MKILNEKIENLHNEILEKLSKKNELQEKLDNGVGDKQRQKIILQKRRIEYDLKILEERKEIEFYKELINELKEKQKEFKYLGEKDCAKMVKEDIDNTKDGLKMHREIIKNLKEEKASSIRRLRSLYQI